MPVEYRTGDLFAYDAADLPAIAHGCNCAGAMGRGIAREFKRRWPAMYAEYAKRCRAGTFALGACFAWEATDRVVYNLATQAHWRDSRADERAIQRALLAMVADAHKRGIARVGLPRIGAGLGGLPWSVVRERVELVGNAGAVTLVVVSLPEDAP